MTLSETIAPRPGTKVVRVGANGEAWIEAFRCDACGAVVPSPTMACRSCGDRAVPGAFRVGHIGRLHSWTIVHRSYPGIAVPFVSAIVDLDDGLSIKGTLRGVDQAALRNGLPVELVLDDAGGVLADDGAPYVGFHFVGREDAQ